MDCIVRPVILSYFMIFRSLSRFISGAKFGAIMEDVSNIFLCECVRTYSVQFLRNCKVCKKSVPLHGCCQTQPKATHTDRGHRTLSLQQSDWAPAALSSLFRSSTPPETMSLACKHCAKLSQGRKKKSKVFCVNFTYFNSNIIFVLISCFVQDGKVEQKWKWPLGRLQTTVTVQVSRHDSYSVHCAVLQTSLLNCIIVVHG